MLEIFNNLKPFFEDCYRRYSVREYAKIIKVSPPTASKILKSLNKEDLLKVTKENNYLFFWANKENKEFISLSRIYWYNKLKEFVDFLNTNLVNPVVILFGSLSKAEAKIDSDIDITIFANKKELNVQEFEEKLKREIQIFIFKSPKDVSNKELLNNILNGFILEGKVKL